MRDLVVLIRLNAQLRRRGSTEPTYRFQVEEDLGGRNGKGNLVCAASTSRAVGSWKDDKSKTSKGNQYMVVMDEVMDRVRSY